MLCWKIFSLTERTVQNLHSILWWLATAASSRSISWLGERWTWYRALHNLLFSASTFLGFKSLEAYSSSRLAWPVRQSSDPSFTIFLNQVAIGTFSSSALLPFKSSKQPIEAYEFVSKRFISKKLSACWSQHYDPISYTHKLVYVHNEAPVNSFPGSMVNLYSSATAEPHLSTQDHHDSPVR